MNLPEVEKFVAACRSYRVHPLNITIKGKDTTTVSFTLRYIEMQELDEMCVKQGWNFSTSSDSFLALGHGRVQLNLQPTAE